MKVIANYPDLSTAEVARSVLEANEIAAWIPDANLAGIDWRLGTALGGVRLQVDDEDAEAARLLLAEVLHVAGEVGTAGLEADETCPHCSSTRIGPDEQRRLRMLTLLLFPLVVITLPLLLLNRGRMRCGDCCHTWRPAPTGAARPDVV